ncbi:Ku protein [Streptomyces katrae]|uniref:Ku protein n=1 Tax=Streptomyces katrae TaxID=68223 RepID=UPI00131AAB97|nr:Ku protein [Streptomyces katrae]
MPSGRGSSLDKTYAPRGAECQKVYNLLQQALEQAGEAGIATFVMRRHEYLVAVARQLIVTPWPWNGNGGVPRHLSGEAGRAKRPDLQLHPSAGRGPGGSPARAVHRTAR